MELNKFFTYITHTDSLVFSPLWWDDVCCTCWLSRERLHDGSDPWCHEFALLPLWVNKSTAYPMLTCTCISWVRQTSAIWSVIVWSAVCIGTPLHKQLHVHCILLSGHCGWGCCRTYNKMYIWLTDVPELLTFFTVWIVKAQKEDNFFVFFWCHHLTHLLVFLSRHFFCALLCEQKMSSLQILSPKINNTCMYIKFILDTTVKKKTFLIYTIHERLCHTC